MPKKKKQKKGDEELPDPRLAALSKLIKFEASRREENEKMAKQTLRPLKRVNSNPYIYEFTPMTRNVFPDSKSVDFGFDGTVDIPNQMVFMEDVEDDDFNQNLPDDMPSVHSMGFLDFDEIEAEELEKLEDMKNHDAWHFLKSRSGKKEAEELDQGQQYQALLGVTPDADKDIQEDSFNDTLKNFWDGLRHRMYIPSLWRANARRLSNSTSEALSVDSVEQFESDVDCIPEKGGEKIDVESPIKIDDGVDDTEAKHVPSIRVFGFGSSRRRSYRLLILVLIVILLLGVLGVVVAAFQGIHIPILSDAINPQTGDEADSAVSQSINTTASILSNNNTISVTAAPSLEYGDEGITSLDDIVSEPGLGPMEFVNFYPTLFATLAGDLMRVNGVPFDVENYNDSTAPPKHIKDAVGLGFYEALQFLGFKVGAVVVTDIVKLQNVAHVNIWAYGRPEKNLGVMKWYGYTKAGALKYECAFTRRLDILMPRVLLERRNTVIERFKLRVGYGFGHMSAETIDSTRIRRAPLRVPDKWGNCDGISLCELTAL